MPPFSRKSSILAINSLININDKSNKDLPGLSDLNDEVFKEDYGYSPVGRRDSRLGFSVPDDKPTRMHSKVRKSVSMLSPSSFLFGSGQTMHQ